MDKLQHLFANNQAWSSKCVEGDPTFFWRLSKQQKPKYLWIGCADSRIPANEIIGLRPGEVFVHRNLANLVVHTDFNCLAVIEFAVEVLGVEHIMVVGHYGCGGVAAALEARRFGMADNWFRHIDDIRLRHVVQLSRYAGKSEMHDRLCELNVIEQVVNVCRTSTVQAAWHGKKKLSIHGWIYGLEDGLMRDLGLTVASDDALQDGYDAATSRPVLRTLSGCAKGHCCDVHAARSPWWLDALTASLANARGRRGPARRRRAKSRQSRACRASDAQALTVALIWRLYGERNEKVCAA